MSFETVTHVIATPVPGPGQRMVHGRLVGPTDEQYPPGTGGPLPNPKNVTHSVAVVVTARDVSSGHTSVSRSRHVPGANEEVDAVAHRAKANPGQPFQVGRPVLSDEEPLLGGSPKASEGSDVRRTSDEDSEKASDVRRTSDEDNEKELENEFASLSDAGREEFFAHEEAPKAPSVRPSRPIVNKGPTTSKMIS